MEIHPNVSDPEFDVVVPVGPNDYDVANRNLEYTKKNIVGLRYIYIITSNSSIEIPGCITIPESIFPFSIDTVAAYHGKSSRNGWYLQQLLKLYAGMIIRGIAGKYLVIDCDTFFLKPTKFFDDGKALYCTGTEHHHPYFAHMNKLHPSLMRNDPRLSGICHHLMFETIYVKQLINMVESYHGKNSSFYKIFLENVNPDDYDKSGASEYELYFNFMMCNNPDKFKLRNLLWENIGDLNLVNHGYDFISCHYYLR